MLPLADAIPGIEEVVTPRRRAAFAPNGMRSDSRESLTNALVIEAIITGPGRRIRISQASRCQLDSDPLACAAATKLISQHR